MNILFIGNSFALDCARWLCQTAADAGVELKVGVPYHGGRTLKKHYKCLIGPDGDEGDYCFYIFEQKNGRTEISAVSQCRLQAALVCAQWDEVIFQQQSIKSGLPESFTSFAGGEGFHALIAALRKVPTCAGARMGYMLPWPSVPGYNNRDYKVIYHQSADKMFDAQLAVTKEIMQSYKELDDLFPVGTAVQNARTNKKVSRIGGHSAIRSLQCSRDYHHMSYGGGRLLAAMAVFGTLFPDRLADVHFYPGEEDTYTGDNLYLQKEQGNISATSEDWMPEVFKKAIEAALKDPYHVTTL